jgi:hypothetical protein
MLPDRVLVCWLLCAPFAIRTGYLLYSNGLSFCCNQPTNDLDVDTIRSLEEALLEYAGCAIVVSHDRKFQGIPELIIFSLYFVRSSTFQTFICKCCVAVLPCCCAVAVSITNCHYTHTHILILICRVFLGSHLHAHPILRGKQ